MHTDRQADEVQPGLGFFKLGIVDVAAGKVIVRNVDGVWRLPTAVIPDLWDARCSKESIMSELCDSVILTDEDPFFLKGWRDIHPSLILDAISLEEARDASAVTPVAVVVEKEVPVPRPLYRAVRDATIARRGAIRFGSTEGGFGEKKIQETSTALLVYQDKKLIGAFSRDAPYEGVFQYLVDLEVRQFSPIEPEVAFAVYLARASSDYDPSGRIWEWVSFQEILSMELDWLSLPAMNCIVDFALAELRRNS